MGCNREEIKEGRLGCHPKLPRHYIHYQQCGNVKSLKGACRLYSQINNELLRLSKSTAVSLQITHLFS